MVLGISPRKTRSVVGLTNRPLGQWSDTVSPHCQRSDSLTTPPSLFDSTQKILKENASPRISPRVALAQDKLGGRLVPHDLGASLPVPLTTLQASPRRETVADGTPAKGSELQRSASQDRGMLYRSISEAAKVKGMRALLFDQFDATSVVHPPIPPPPEATTRFASRKDPKTAPLVQPTPGCPSHAGDSARYGVVGNCHLGSTIGAADVARELEVHSARVVSARQLRERCLTSIATSEEKLKRVEDQRIQAKSIQQQKYVELTKEK